MQLDAARSGLPIAITVAVTVVDPVGAALAVRRAGQALDLQLHQALRGKSHHLTQQIGVGALLQQGAKAHHLVGHRWILGSVEHVPTKPYPRLTMTTAVDKWPASARLMAVATADHLPTAPTPFSGTRPPL